jgi:hypothetical protein
MRKTREPTFHALLVGGVVIGSNTNSFVFGFVWRYFGTTSLEEFALQITARAVLFVQGALSRKRQDRQRICKYQPVSSWNGHSRACGSEWFALGTCRETVQFFFTLTASAAFLRWRDSGRRAFCVHSVACSEFLVVTTTQANIRLPVESEWIALPKVVR